MDLPDVLRERLLVLEDQPLAARTTLGVGGPAPVVIEPRTREELMLAVRELNAAGLPFRMLGGGSNLMVSDDGVSEVVIATARMQGIWHDGEREHALRLAAGTSLVRAIQVAQRQGLAGLETLIGIPGTVGGAVANNAGGRHGWIGDLLVEVTVVEPDGAARAVPCAPADFGYRRSPFGGRVILDAVVQLAPEPPRAIWERLSAILRDKRASQPLAARSAGCVFRNSGELAGGKLIDEAGCKGLAVGAARVSPRHANFVVNEGGATARDVEALIEQVRERVAACSGRRLELEIERWSPLDD